MKYLLLGILALAMGFTTNCAAMAFARGYFFAFGIHIAFDIYWVLQLILLVFKP